MDFDGNNLSIILRMPMYSFQRKIPHIHVHSSAHIGGCLKANILKREEVLHVQFFSENRAKHKASCQWMHVSLFLLMDNYNISCIDCLG
ncbi:hypothetical protein V6Z11_D12G234600 [Gossypium hirsutum]